MATNPTGMPPNRANAVTICPAHRGQSSRNSPSSHRRADHLAGVVGGGLAVGDDRAQLGRRAQHRVADRRQRRDLVGVRRAGTRAARPRPRSTSSDSTAHSPLDVAWMAVPPSSLIPIRIPVNSATICGPDTKAKASELITTRSASPSRRAGPETTGPVAAAITGTCPEHGRSRRPPAPTRAARPRRRGRRPRSTPRRRRKGSRGGGPGPPPRPSLTPSAWVMAPRRMVPSDRAMTASRTADAPDDRRDGAHDALAHVGWSLQAGHDRHRCRM